MIRVAGQFVQLAPFAFFDRHARAARGLNEFVQARLMRARRDQDFVNLASARAQSFERRRETVDLIHRVDQPQ
jgi:hypothetical protein